jgi:DNA-binding MarR family transcriptional regulator
MKKSGFDGNLTGQVGFLLKRAQQAFRAQMDNALASNGLTTSQYAVLAHLRESPGLSNAELARRSFVTAPTMIRIIQDLEKLEFIARSENTKHKKVIDIVLTQKGQKVLESCNSTVASIQKRMISGMTHSEVTQLSALLLGCAERLESISKS